MHIAAALRDPAPPPRKESTASRRYAAYNGPVADIPKVPQDKFEAVIRALLKAPPMPLSDIPRKREAKAQGLGLKRTSEKKRVNKPA